MEEMATFRTDPDAIFRLKPGLPAIHVMRLYDGILLTTANHEGNWHTAGEKTDPFQEGMGRGGMEQSDFQQVNPAADEWFSLIAE